MVGSLTTDFVSEERVDRNSNEGGEGVEFAIPSAASLSVLREVRTVPGNEKRLRR
jgi:hypothetical protein